MASTGAVLTPEPAAEMAARDAAPAQAWQPPAAPSAPAPDPSPHAAAPPPSDRQRLLGWLRGEGPASPQQGPTLLRLFDQLADQADPELLNQLREGLAELASTDIMEPAKRRDTGAKILAREVQAERLVSRKGQIEAETIATGQIEAESSRVVAQRVTARETVVFEIGRAHV